MKAYLANDLFSEAMREYNRRIAHGLRNLGIEVYNPMENEAINDKSKSATAVEIFNGDTSELLSSDILVAVLDGPVVDPGVAAEIGFIAAECEIGKKKQIFGLFTDCREMSKTANNCKLDQSISEPGENQFPYINLYVTGAIKKYGKIATNLEELFRFVEEYKNA